jgi:hypothetical protein
MYQAGRMYQAGEGIPLFEQRRSRRAQTEPADGTIQGEVQASYSVSEPTEPFVEGEKIIGTGTTRLTPAMTRQQADELNNLILNRLETRRGAPPDPRDYQANLTMVELAQIAHLTEHKDAKIYEAEREELIRTNLYELKMQQPRYQDIVRI